MLTIEIVITRPVLLRPVRTWIKELLLKSSAHIRTLINHLLMLNILSTACLYSSPPRINDL